MDRVYFDWAHGKVDVLFNDSDEVRTFCSLNDLLDTLKAPALIVGEATFESFWRETNRNDIIRRCEREGHDLRTIPNRATGRWKKRIYPEETYPQFYKQGARFPDDLAVDLIRRIVQGGVHLKKPRLFDPDDPFIELREQANTELMALRNTKTYGIGPRGGRTETSAKDQFGKALIELLPAYAEQPDVRKIALGNGKQYSNCVVAAVGVATKHSGGDRETFERLAGLYHHGYPSQIRSDLHLHGWWRAAPGKPRKGELIKLTDYRRELRWMFHRLKTVDWEKLQI